MTHSTEFFHRVEGELFIEKVPLSAIAKSFGTPCYVYSRAALDSVSLRYDQAFSQGRDQVHYAVKANGNLAV